MRHDQPTTPFDVEADDVTQQFWGASKGWVSGEHTATVRRRAAQPDLASRPRRDDTTGSLRAIREGFAALRPQTAASPTGEVRRQRQHGAPRPTPPEAGSRDHSEATLGELARGRIDAGWLDDELLDDGHFHAAGQGRRVVREPEPEYDVPLTPVQPLVERLGLGAVDPLLLRAGAFVLAMILLVPVMLSLRPDRDDSLPGEVVEAPQQVVAGAAPAAVDALPSASTTTAAATAAVSTEALTTASSPEPGEVVDDGARAAEQSDAADPAPSSGTDTRLTESADAATDSDAAAVDVAAERVVPACPQTYTAAPGDSWYRIADEAGVTPSELLAENTATTDTVILPGDDICLPEGAAMPTAPATTDVQTTEPEPDVEPSTTTTPTTSAPTTTTAPTTTAAPVANLSRSEVQELIRQTWPEEEVDKALAVARRESNFVATADNGWCCYGVFQIYWTVHDGWLDEFGITERSDLFDARKNVAAAYAMWQRSGWGPWGG